MEGLSNKNYKLAIEIAKIPEKIRGYDLVKRNSINSAKIHEKELLNMIALERIGDPIEVSKVISFLLSDDSSYITGTTIDIDGGFSIRKIN